MLCSSALSDSKVRIICDSDQELTSFKAPYLKEWIEFYRMLGVEYFAIYDKSLGKNSMNVLDPYLKAGIVS
mgnify:CR=1 FL=1